MGLTVHCPQPRCLEALLARPSSEAVGLGDPWVGHPEVLFLPPALHCLCPTLCVEVHCCQVVRGCDPDVFQCSLTNLIHDVFTVWGADWHTARYSPVSLCMMRRGSLVTTVDPTRDAEKLECISMHLDEIYLRMHLSGA